VTLQARNKQHAQPPPLLTLVPAPQNQSTIACATNFTLSQPTYHVSLPTRYPSAECLLSLLFKFVLGALPLRLGVFARDLSKKAAAFHLQLPAAAIKMPVAFL
jgi:hypothetical protein